MGKTTGHILKGDNVKLEGQFHLDLIQAGPDLPEKEKNAPITPTARIVESHSEFVLVEITCSCGTRTRLKCEYSGDGAPVDRASVQTK